MFIGKTVNPFLMVFQGAAINLIGFKGVIPSALYSYLVKL